ncbi:hypothetical protein CSV61_06725 [Sporosarcina sp. P3]|uniref:hypothetical protein n=1 Tax=Sporosarcina sp. P3 TaxID=2048245 RepID=UPI000C16FB46|nr:hypothetical protein [Sporosarcina sp. P3]PID21907.1 hypothetical protein CSV61_06725 [Sporosarcina sp. P3]
MSNVLKPGGEAELSTPKGQELNCSTASGLWYFDHFMEAVKPPAVYKKFVTESKERIWVWDPYVRAGDEVLFEDVSKEVDIRILTSDDIKTKIPLKTEEFIAGISSVQQSAQFKLELRIYNTNPNEEKGAFHDRYLFVDKHVYSVGASIQHHRRRLTSTSIHQILQEDAKSLIEEKFRDVWNHQNTQSAITLIGGRL